MQMECLTFRYSLFRIIEMVLTLSLFLNSFRNIPVYYCYIRMVILNRWGNVMAEIYDVNGGWDGRTNNGALAAEGVYFVKYKITGLTGEVVEGHTFFHLFH
jgi:hypothetical protein